MDQSQAEDCGRGAEIDEACQQHRQSSYLAPFRRLKSVVVVHGEEDFQNDVVIWPCKQPMLRPTKMVLCHAPDHRMHEVIGVSLVSVTGWQTAQWALSDLATS